MRSLISRLKGLTEFLLLAMLLLVGWGSGPAMAQWFTSPGGGSGGFAGRPLITVELYVDNDQTSASVPVNLAGVGPNPSLPYTRTLTAVVRQDGRLFPTNIQFDLAPNLASGALFDPEDLTQGFRSLPLENTSGIATAFFHASSTPGEVTITASAQDPNTGQSVSASVKITVVDEKRPPAAITFTGPYVNAVIAGQSQFGGAETPILNGSYSRVISVVVNDLNGNPTNPNTQVNFYLIDGPITGYPSTPGAFFVAGSNGDPAEGQFLLSALDPSGNFVSKGVRPYDRLVLDGRQTTQSPLPNNAFHTGVWSVQNVVSETALTIIPAPQGRPFNAGDDNGFTVPYVVGRAQNAAVLSPSFTDLSGVASTMLTYPVERVGQTAIVVACVANTNTCGILNTCDRNGANCKSAYLGVTNGSDRTLTVSATSLGPNRSTDVQMCLRDVNFTPLPATEIRYDIGSRGPAKVTVNGLEDNPGKILTGENGCTVAKIASSGQIPGSQEIPLQFTADYVAEPATVTIRSPGAGKMDGFFTCVNTPSEGTGRCEGTLRLTDDEGSPMADVLIALGSVVAPGEFELTFNPADGVFGKTDASGQLQVTVEMKSPGEYTFPFQTASGGTATYTLTTTVTAPGALAVTLVGATEAALGLPYSATLQAEGGVPPVTWTLTSGSLPPGVTLSANGSISGTPTQEGTFSFAVQAKDKNELTGFGAFTITVGKQADLTVTLDPTLGAVNAPFSGVVSATGGTEPYNFTLLAGSLPPGLSLNASGTLSGTPTAVGTFAFSVKATDSKGATGTGNFSLTISSASPVTVTLEGGGTGQVGVPFTDGVVTATGGAPPYTFRETTGVLATAGLSLSSSGAITGTPTRAGALTFTVEASDRNGLKGTGTITVTISESGGGTGEPLTIATTTLPEATAGSAYTAALSATGGSTPYKWSLIGAPPGISIDPLTGFITGTPTTAGTFSLIAQVTDSSSSPQSANANLSLTVKAGGGGGSTANPEALGLATTQTSVKSNNSDIATITATVLDADNVGISGKVVNFSATGGQLSASSVVTDDAGNASVEFRSGTVNNANQVVSITATVGRTATTENPATTLTRVIPIQIGGTSLQINATKTSLPANGVVTNAADVAQVEVTLLDSGNLPIFDSPVCFVQTRSVLDPQPSPGSLAFFNLQNTAVIGPACTIENVNGAGVQVGKTDVNGKLTFLVTGVNSGDVTLNAGASGTRVSQDFTVQPAGQVFEIIAPAIIPPATTIPPQLIETGSFTVTVSNPRAGASKVRFTTSLGTWVDAPPGSPTIIDVNVIDGKASAVLKSTNAGLANVVVSDVDAVPPLTDNIQLQFTANICDATKLILDASPRVVPISTGGVQNVSTLVATLLTGLDQPVAGAVVGFSLQSSTGGGEIISPPTAITSSTGEAKTTFISGARASSADGITVRATVNKPDTCSGGASSLTADFKMVITDKAGSVVIGASTTVESINQDTAYSLPMSVLVADINGNPVRNTTVSLSAWPVSYSTGIRQGNFGTGNPSEVFISDTFSNEDINENTICDQPSPPNTPATSVCPSRGQGEDVNADGVLTPANTAAGNLPLTVITDQNGLATFNLVYLKQYADWIVDRIRASALVGGTQIVSELVLGLAGSVSDETADPPVLPSSPFNAVCPFSVSVNPPAVTVTVNGTPVPVTLTPDEDPLSQLGTTGHPVQALVDSRNLQSARVSPGIGANPLAPAISAVQAGVGVPGGTAVVRYFFSCAFVDVQVTVKP